MTTRKEILKEAQKCDEDQEFHSPYFVSKFFDPEKRSAMLPKIEVKLTFPGRIDNRYIVGIKQILTPLTTLPSTITEKKGKTIIIKWDKIL